MNRITVALAFLLLASAAGAAPRVPVSPTFQYGKASFYGSEWTTSKAHPRRGIMANGKPFDPTALTAACWNYPLGSTLQVTNEANGRQVTVKVTDRGPAQHLGRLLDLSEAAATRLGYTHAGVTYVAVRLVSSPKP